MPSIQKRIVLHFAGFEPLDAVQHRERFVRAAAQTSAAWNIAIQCTPLQQRDNDGAMFLAQASGPNWQTKSEIHILELSKHIETLDKRSFFTKLATGYTAFAKVLWWCGLWQYFRHAWRFGGFFLFPFVLMTAGLLATGWLALSPWFLSVNPTSFIATIPLALALFKYGFLPLADRLYTTLLFSDWKCAADFASLGDARLNKRIEEMVVAAHQALKNEADEYLIVSHSIGGQSAVQVIGTLLECFPALFDNKKIIFATIGSGLLQSALLRSATKMRARMSAIADHPSFTWFDVQCHTDIVNFYKAEIAKAAGYQGKHQPQTTTIRVRSMLEKARYDRIKYDLMRVHRQYVMGNDKRANFDFPLVCAGPLPSSLFATLKVGHFAPIDHNGAMQLQSNVAGFTV